MSALNGTASIKIELDQGNSQERTSLQPKRKSRNKVAVCGCCCLFTLVLIVLLAVIFWPRLLIVCIHYAQLTARLQTAAAPQSVSVDLVVPVSIKSSNLWGLKLDLLTITAYYSGNSDVAISSGKVNGLELKANGKSDFDVAASPAALSVAQVGNVYDYFMARCGPLADSGTWLMDLHVSLEAYGQKLAFWIRELELPCVPITPVVPLAYAGSSDDCDGDDSQTPGQFCMRLLCAIDDLNCEKECPLANSPLSPPAPPPAAP